MIDTHGIIRFVQCDFLGHQNDAQQARLMSMVQSHAGSLYKLGQGIGNVVSSEFSSAQVL